MRRGRRRYWTEDVIRTTWRAEAKRLGRAPTLDDLNAAAVAGRTCFASTLMAVCGSYVAFCRQEGYAPNASGPKVRRQTRDRRSPLNERDSLDVLIAEGKRALERHRQLALHNERVKLHWLTTDRAVRDASHRRSA